MIRFWDGFLSALCAMATIGVIGLPLWGTFRAVRADLVPVWFWAPMLLLAFVGAVMVWAFLRKAVRGVHPLRERRR
ncbi:MAG: hypothetical protein RIE24_23030 [Silicimonas sp.]